MSHPPRHALDVNFNIFTFKTTKERHAIAVPRAAGPVRQLGELGSRLGHHSSGHASGASKCLFWGHQNVFAKTLLLLSLTY